MAIERKHAQKKEDLELHFKEFKEAIENFGIVQSDIYNFDETEFRISCINSRIVIIYINTKALYLSDPKNREFLTLVECIYADSSSIQPMVVI
jgi:hypothetical protein